MKKKFFLLLVMLGASLCASRADIRVMSYNVRHCAGMKSDLNLERTASVIERYHPDFVALQELDSCASRSGGVDQASELGRLALMHPTYASTIPLQGGSYGVGILSKQRPLSVRRIPMPSRSEDRVLLVCEFSDCVVACTHISLLEDEHLASAEIIISEASRWQKPFIIMGDWNSEPDSPFIDRMKEYFTILSDTKALTFPADKPEICIDYVAVYNPRSTKQPQANNNATTPPAVRRNVWVIEDSVSSDHRPIVADIVLKTPAGRLMTTKPYLQDPRPDEMTVMFQTTSVCHAWVEYGTDSLHTQRARTLIDGQEVCYNLENKIRLTHLRPGQRYYYRVCAVELMKKRSYETVYGDTLKTKYYSFVTPSDEQEDFTALIFNDLHQNQKTYEALLQLVKDTDYDFVIFNGDCLPEPSNFDDAVRMIHKCADPVNGAEKPLIFIRGNHEIRNFYSAGMHSLIGYRDDKTYGAFTWGDTRFVILDAGEDKPDSTPVYAGLNDFTQLRLDQADFLKQELKGKPFRKAAHRVLISHIPVFGNVDDYRPCTELWASLVKNQPFSLHYASHNHEAKFYPNGTEGCTYPVLVGGGPSLSNCAVSILTKRGKTLHIKTLTPEGVFLDQDL